MDRLGRPRTDILAFTMPGFATGDDHQGQRHPARRRRSASPSRSSTSRRRPGRCWPTSTTRSPTASRSTTSPSRTCRPGCAPTTSSGWPTTAAASCSAPATSPSWRSGWCTYGVGDQMSHYNVNAGVPKTLIQHLIRWVADSRAVRATTPTRCSARSLDQEITPELIPADDGRAAVDRGHGRALRAAGLHALPRRSAAATGRARSPSSPGTPGATQTAGDWPPNFPDDRRHGVRPGARSGAGCEVFVQRFFASQFKRSALPNGPKVSAGGTMSPARRLADAVGRLAPRPGWPRSTRTSRPPPDATCACWLPDMRLVVAPHACRVARRAGS